ncbi:hypothetical protein [uncultured Tenacibaculum sp.]|uniref:hypothetical protein n=1 Tax=uncultured Tenacibaculum sp. TaxID=174713 RepID=UPI00262978E8|nr:hypothetical protein [uncultured Tenacibaculum sp.]
MYFKKLFCIALFSIVIMTNATGKKEIITNLTNGNEIVTNSSENIIINSFKKIETESNKRIKETSKDDLFFGCGSQGNSYYNELMATGNYTHRDARAYRRVFVRGCRGNGPNGWLGITFQLLSSGVTL